MPNHISNKLTIQASPERIAEIFAAIAGTYEGDYKPRPIDFEKIIPQPALLQNTSSGSRDFDGVRVRTWWTDGRDLPHDHPDRKPDRRFTDEEEIELATIGATSWYDWNCNNWGTKWNAYDQKVIDDKSIYFETAWSPPIPVIVELSRCQPDATFILEYADEDIGSNAGIVEYKGGQVRREVTLHGPTAVEHFFSLNPEQDIAESGYDPETFEYVEDDEEEIDDEEEEAAATNQE